MKSRILMFIIAFIVWCGLNWVPDVQHLIVGAVVSLIVTLVMGSMLASGRGALIRPIRCIYFLFWYLPVFLWELFKANLDVAYRVGHPGLPIKPGIVKLKTKLKSDIGLTFLANSITLTPGTLTVDVNKEEGVLYVHWINVAGTDVETATANVGGRFEPILMRIFEENVES